MSHRSDTPRAAMRSPTAIRARMAEDIAALLDERCEDAQIDSADLSRLGWSGSQIVAHSGVSMTRALQIAKTDRDAA